MRLHLDATRKDNLVNASVVSAVDVLLSSLDRVLLDTGDILAYFRADLLNVGSEVTQRIIGYINILQARGERHPTDFTYLLEGGEFLD